MCKNTGDMLAEIKDGIAWLESTLPSRIAGMELSERSKIPFKILMCRAAFGWRFAELCRSGCNAFQEERLVSGILLTRGAIETAAGVWYLSEQTKRAVDESCLGSLDDRLLRLLCGNRTDAEMPNPVHVNDFLASVEKQVQGFRAQYDRLCEFAHPNWAGTLLSYSRPDADERCAYFGPYLRKAENIKTHGVVNLSVAILTFRKVYDDIESLMPGFIALCERELGHEV